MAEKSMTVGLIVSIVSGLAVSFFSSPLLGYHFEVTPPSDETPDIGVFDIHVFNYGLATAESLTVVVEAKDSSSTFDFTSNPYVGNMLVVMDETREGFGFAELGFLPPLTGITFTVYANNTEDSSEDFIVYVQSKQASAYPTPPIWAIGAAAAILLFSGSVVIRKTRK